MAVKIRLMRVGKKKQPSYRVVVADARSPRDGRIIETIGHYGPREEPSSVQIDGDRALLWLRRGAKPTEQVQKLLAISGVWAAFQADRPRVVTKLQRRGLAAAPTSPSSGPSEASSSAPRPQPPEPPATQPAAEERVASEQVGTEP